MLLLCALVVGGSAWAAEETFTFGSSNRDVSNETAVTKNGVTVQVTQNNATNAPNFNDNQNVRFQSGNKMTITTTGTITQVVFTYTSSSYAKLSQEAFNSGTYSYTTNSTTGTWTGSTSSLEIINTASSQARIKQIDVTYTSNQATCATPTFSLTEGLYTSTQSVTISCETSGATIYYTTDGSTPTTSSNVYSSAISISSTTTIKAIATKNNYLNSSVASATYTIFILTDGVFDFEHAAAAEEDYDSEMTMSSDYTTVPKTWIAGNVTMITSGKYRWWSADKTLRFYETSYMAFSVPEGYVITKIDRSSGTISNPDVGAISGQSWVGASRNVTLQASGNFKSITVTYAACVNVTVTSAGLATFVYNDALDYTNVSGIEAYIAKEESGAIKLYQVNKVPAGTGVLLRATDGGTSFNVPVTTATTDIVSGNILVRGSGVAVASQWGSYYNYILNEVEGQIGFYRANNQTVPTNRAYLQTTINASDESRIELTFDGQTGIATVNRETTTNNRYFDLQGRRVAQPTKGLYIVNGKKVIIK